MSFRFNPLSQEQIDGLSHKGLLPDGVYKFIIKDVKQSTSKSGNAMLELLLGIADGQGWERNIFDYLVSMDRMVFKIKHLCESVGLEETYAKGEFDPKCLLHKIGHAQIGVQKGARKDDGSFYPDKNVVKDYVKSDKVETITEKLDDKIPF
jgi:hypothetical protein